MTLHDKIRYGSTDNINVMHKVLYVKDVKEAVKELIERIKINGNLSNHIIETEDGEFQHRHNFELNNIVIEIIEEIFGEGLIHSQDVGIKQLKCDSVSISPDTNQNSEDKK